jgi:hypothetical protein
MVGEGVGLRVLVADGVFDGVGSAGNWVGVQALVTSENVRMPNTNQYRFKVSPNVEKISSILLKL